MRPFGNPARTRASVGLSVASVVVGMVCLAHPAHAQWGQDSPHKLELNHTFYFNGDKSFYAKAPDCKAWQDAMRDLDAMREAGVGLTTIKGKKAAISFVDHAYKGLFNIVQTDDLESVFVATVDPDRFRVFTGNEPKQVVCGFDRPQYLDKRWFEAGLQGKDVPHDPTPPSPLDPLLSAYRWQRYSLVRPSLLQRGYSAFSVPEPVAKRCAPTTEPLCEEYPEAVCDSDLLNGITCMFVFQRDGTRQLVGVIASVEHLTAYTARITVNDLRELQKTAD